MAHHPGLLKIGNVFRGADADIFPHPERLQPVEMAGQLGTKAIGCDVENAGRIGGSLSGFAELGARPDRCWDGLFVGG
jgi:hypothetical protein